MTFVDMSGLAKNFGASKVVRCFDLQIQRGEFISLLGPSGCGKTTVLRMIAGFETASAGRIVIDGEDVTDLGPARRKVGMVFQAYALFPNMSVAANVGFGLKIAGRPQAEIAARVREMLDLVKLSHLAARFPFQLSGGQQQRVALARALAVKPRVLLLDEPLSALDAKIRVSLREEILSVQRALGITTIFVTHDQEEALEVADRVVVMNDGRIEQIGTPDEVYDHPAGPFVYEFLGHVNLFHGRVHRGRATIGDIELDAPEHAEAEQQPAVAYVRPHDIEIERVSNGEAALPVRIVHVLAVGPVIRVELVREGGEQTDPIKADISRERFRELKLVAGERVFIRPRRYDLFPRQLH